MKKSVGWNNAAPPDVSEIELDTLNGSSSVGPSSSSDDSGII